MEEIEDLPREKGGKEKFRENIPPYSVLLSSRLLVNQVNFKQRKGD